MFFLGRCCFPNETMHFLFVSGVPSSFIQWAARLCFKLLAIVRFNRQACQTSFKCCKIMFSQYNSQRMIKIVRKIKKIASDSKHFYFRKAQFNWMVALRIPTTHSTSSVETSIFKVTARFPFSTTGVDGCLLANLRCRQRCAFSDAGYSCSCARGYRLHSNKQDCVG